MRSKLKIPRLKEEVRLRPDIAKKIEKLFKCEEESLLGISNLRQFVE